MLIRGAYVMAQLAPRPQIQHTKISGVIGASGIHDGPSYRQEWQDMKENKETTPIIFGGMNAMHLQTR